MFQRTIDEEKNKDRKINNSKHLVKLHYTANYKVNQITYHNTYLPLFDMIIWSWQSRNLDNFSRFFLQFNTMAPCVYISDDMLGKTHAWTESEVCECMNSTIVEGDRSLSKLSIKNTELQPPRSLSSLDQSLWLLLFASSVKKRKKIVRCRG